MQTAYGKAANLIEGEQLVELIEEYLRDDLHFSQARAAANALIEQLRKRASILCWLGGDSYAFVHRTFLEYFCAAEFVHQFERKRSLSLDDLLALYDAHCREDDWQEVLRLICGQLDESFAGRIIARLTDQIDITTWGKQGTPFPELLLAVLCLSEVRHLNRIEEQVGLDLFSKVRDCFLIKKEIVRENRNPGMSELLTAVESIGALWPGNLVFQFNGQRPTMEDSRSCCWPHFLASIFQKKEWIIQLSQTKNSFVRIGAIESLARYWPDDNTKELLKFFLLQDRKDDVRRAALQQLSIHWTSDEVNELFFQVVMYDSAEENQCAALEVLSTCWSDEEIEKLLRKLSPTRGGAASMYGERYSFFGKIVFQFNPHLPSDRWYLNPFQPIPSEYIQKAAKAAGIPPDKIDENVRSLSAHMGWDITKGSLAGKL